MSECIMMNKPQASYETRLRAVQAVLTGMSRGEVALAYGIDRTTLCRWLIRFRSAGAAGLSRKPGSGRPPRNGKKSETPTPFIEIADIQGLSMHRMDLQEQF